MGGLRATVGLLAALALASAAYAAPRASEWRTVEAENLWVIDTAKGRILIELTPAVAPDHVVRVRELTREGYYDGSLFYRVISRFVAQGGARAATGPFTSGKPDLKGEFTIPGLDAAAEWLGVLPIRRGEDGAAFARFCPGTAAFTHYDDPDTANSQFYIMREAGPSLERQYTPFGRVVSGLEVVRALNVGEPPAEPDQMVRVRLAADIPQGERPVVEVMVATGPTFQSEIAKARKAREKARLPFSPCDVPVPSRVR